jgi:hypothetical protein
MRCKGRPFCGVIYTIKERCFLSGVVPQCKQIPFPRSIPSKGNHSYVGGKRAEVRSYHLVPNEGALLRYVAANNKCSHAYGVFQVNTTRIARL